MHNHLHNTKLDYTEIPVILVMGLPTTDAYLTVSDQWVYLTYGSIENQILISAEKHHKKKEN